MKKYLIYGIIAIAIIAVLYYFGKKSKAETDEKTATFKQPDPVAAPGVDLPDDFKVINTDNGFKQSEAPEVSDEEVFDDIDFAGHSYF
jgi:hypothetical protein